MTATPDSRRLSQTGANRLGRRGCKGRLSLLAGLFALATLILIPAIVFAEAPAIPTWQTDAPTSGDGTDDGGGDGTMVLKWNIADRATGGYQYRYETDAAAFFSCASPPTTPECQWKDATDSANAITYTIDTGTLTVGTIYWFQIRAVNDEVKLNDDSDDTYSNPSAIVSAVQRALPPKVENLVATAGNAQVTLTWTHLAAYDITSYIILREGGAGGGYQDLDHGRRGLRVQR